MTVGATQRGPLACRSQSTCPERFHLNKRGQYWRNVAQLRHAGSTCSVGFSYGISSIRSGRTCSKKYLYAGPPSLSGRMYGPTINSPQMRAHSLIDQRTCAARGRSARGFSSLHTCIFVRMQPAIPEDSVYRRLADTRSKCKNIHYYITFFFLN